jgi:hypothetical protein
MPRTKKHTNQKRAHKAMASAAASEEEVPNKRPNTEARAAADAPSKVCCKSDVDQRYTLAGSELAELGLQSLTQHATQDGPMTPDDYVSPPTPTPEDHTAAPAAAAAAASDGPLKTSVSPAVEESPPPPYTAAAAPPYAAAAAAAAAAMEESTHIDPPELLLQLLQRAVGKGGACKKPEYHGVFSCGTVVRFQLSQQTFAGFKDSVGYEFPEHLLDAPASDTATMLDQNEAVLRKRLDDKHVVRDGLTPDEYTQAVHTAYLMLVLDGYVHPGGEGADRVAVPLPGGPNRAMVVFPARDMYVYNLIAPSMLKKQCVTLNVGEMAVLGGDMRCADYMQPNLVALVTPALQMHRLDVVDCDCVSPPTPTPEDHTAPAAAAAADGPFSPETPPLGSMDTGDVPPPFVLGDRVRFDGGLHAAYTIVGGVRGDPGRVYIRADDDTLAFTGVVCCLDKVPVESAKEEKEFAIGMRVSIHQDFASHGVAQGQEGTIIARIDKGWWQVRWAPGKYKGFGSFRHTELRPLAAAVAAAAVSDDHKDNTEVPLNKRDVNLYPMRRQTEFAAAAAAPPLPPLKRQPSVRRFMKCEECHQRKPDVHEVCGGGWVVCESCRFSSEED